MNLNSPLVLALQCAFWVSLLSTAFCAILSGHYKLGLSLGFLFTQFIASAIICFGLIYFIFKKYISDRLKILYRSINKFKIIDHSKLDINLRRDILTDVSKEALKWSIERTSQINALEEREKFRREFIGNLSHELRTPIFTVQGYLLTLLEGGLEDKKVNIDFLNRANDGIERLVALIDDLDSVSRLESGNLILNKSNFDIGLLAQKVANDLAFHAKRKKISIHIPQLKTNSFMVYADKDKITQVFNNLINNSIHYGNKDGHITITFYDYDQTIFTEIKDDGQGINEDDLPRIFERFYRVSKSRNRNEGGSGLGLAIVKHIIDAHKQSIDVESTINVGTAFNFSLQKAN